NTYTPGREQFGKALLPAHSSHPENANSGSESMIDLAAAVPIQYSRAGAANIPPIAACRSPKIRMLSRLYGCERCLVSRMPVAKLLPPKVKVGMTVPWTPTLVPSLGTP